MCIRDRAIFDAGGDPVGAAALGLLSDRFEQAKEDTEVLYIINTLRPLQGSVEEIVQMLHEIEEKRKLKVTALVNNTNLALETEAQHVVKGQEIVEKVSRELKLPIAFACAKENIFREIQGKINCPLKKIKIYMRPEWLDSTR